MTNFIKFPLTFTLDNLAGDNPTQVVTPLPFLLDARSETYLVKLESVCPLSSGVSPRLLEPITIECSLVAPQVQNATLHRPLLGILSTDLHLLDNVYLPVVEKLHSEIQMKFTGFHNQMDDITMMSKFVIRLSLVPSRMFMAC